jgi:cobalt-precorrin-5B (C1)-methyltransferase
MALSPKPALRRGWTTGACATAAAGAAYAALVTGEFPDPVTIRLPRGGEASFALAFEGLDAREARAGIIKDAGDDPDVTHGALIIARVSPGAPGTGITFLAGDGVGTVTKPGLPVAPGEPAINPVPRRMIAATIAGIAAAHHQPGDAVVEISIPGGAELAAKTWNPRLGIIGGLSILGTTGIVTPYSCAAWISSIHSGVDVARAAGAGLIGAATGTTSEAALERAFALDPTSLIDMGDFAGGLLKYLRRHPVPHLVIAGGFAKMAKLGQGFLDLHSGRSAVDFVWLADKLAVLGGDPVTCARARTANTANEVLKLGTESGLDIAGAVAAAARASARATLRAAPVRVTTLVVDRAGAIVGRADG